MINIVHDIGYRLLGKIGDGMDGSHLHLLVNGFGVNVESSAEDVWESDHVVDLVGIVASACRHEHVGTACHGILVADFRHGVGEGEDDGAVGHGAYHVL